MHGGKFALGFEWPIHGGKFVLRSGWDLCMGGSLC